MQTLEPPQLGPGGQPEPRWRAQGPALVATLVALPVMLLLVMTMWGVLIAIAAAIAVGAVLYIRKEGFAFVQVVGFLIHFEGLGRGPITIGRLISVLVVMLFLYRLMVLKWRPPAVPLRHWLPPLVLVVWAALTGLWAENVGSWFFAMGLLGLGVAYFCVTAFLIDSHDNIEKFLRAYWYGGLFGVLGGLIGLALGNRSWGMSGDANYFGLLNASMIPLTVYYRRHARTALERNIYSFVLVTVMLAAAGAGSRSGLIGTALVMIATMVTKPGLGTARRMGTVLKSLALVALVIPVLFVLNPHNTQRGLADRGAGRLDLWAAAGELIGERPLLGYGANQLGERIAQRLYETPGSQRFTDERGHISAHNTWMDVMGDMGLIGLLIYVSCYVVAAWGLLRPRWQQYREISTLLAVMMVPIVAGSWFLPLVNAKLAWSVIGLSAALQVSSWGARYKGWFSPQQQTPVTEWTAASLARWDLRVSRRFRVYIVGGALAVGFVFGVFSVSQPARHFAVVDVVVPDLVAPPGPPRYPVDREQTQRVHTLVRSDAFAGELIERAGLDADPKEVRRKVAVYRKQWGIVLEVSFEGRDPELVRSVAPHMLPALTAVTEGGRTLNADALSEELRPVVPGEAREYLGPLYLAVSEEPTFRTQEPRVVWNVMVGFLVGGLAATGFVLAQQRRPRVNNDDDFPSAVGMELWTHIGHLGSRNAASPAQYAQVTTVLPEVAGTPDMPRRVVVASPHGDRAAMGLAMGVAASLAAQGRPVVLVDAAVDRPRLSRRLAGRRAPGLGDVAAGRCALADVVRRVPRWRLPRPVRRTLAGGSESIRFVPAGRPDGRDAVDPTVLDRLDPGVVAIVLAPAMLGEVPVGPVLGWADAVMYTLVEGRTVTFDAEEGAVAVRTLAGDTPAGVVLADV